MGTRKAGAAKRGVSKANAKAGSKAAARPRVKARAKPAAKPTAKARPKTASKPKAATKPKAKPKYQLKTTQTGSSVDAFLDAIPDERRRNDAKAVLKLMREITGEPPKMWGPSIVGFGTYHYRYESGHEGDMCVAGFSPRSTALTLYVIPGFDRNADLMARLGKFSTGKSCLYVKRLDDVDQGVLRELIAMSVAEVRRKYAAA